MRHLFVSSTRLAAAPTRRSGHSVALWLLVALTGLHAQSPELGKISPRSARPGETVTVTLGGNNLVQPQQIWTSFGAQTEWTPPTPDKDGKVPKLDGKKLIGKLSLAREAPLGIGFIRLPTAAGMTGPLFFLVDDLAVIQKDGRNASADKAHLLKLPAAVEGDAEAGRSDFYRVELHAGESISVEVFASRIGSKMDPVLRLLDAKGRQLASVDDTHGLAGDCRLRYHATADSPLLIEIRDSAYAGGGEHFYHLRVGDFPLVSALFPPAAASGKPVEVRAVGEAVEGIAPLKVTPQKSLTGVVSVPVRFAESKPAAFASVRTDDSPSYIEKEPNDTPEQGLAVTAPCTVYGCINRRGDRDVFLLATKKGESITLTPMTRDVGSLAVLFLGVDDDHGKFIASNDTPGNAVSNDMALTFRAPADGLCRVSVEDIGRRGGDEFVYGVHIARGTPGFDLTAAGDRFVAPRGGVFSTKVTVQRRAVNGPITLDLVSGDAQPLPKGFSCEQNIIEKGKNETELKVTVPANVPSGTLYHVCIVGYASEGDIQLSANASPPSVDPKKAPKEAAYATLLSMPQPPRLLCETFPVCVGPEAPDFFAIELTTSGVELPTIVGKNTFVLRQKSIDQSFAGEARLKFDGLPPGVSIKSESGRGGRIKGQVDFICEVSGPADIAPGVHAFEITASGEHKGVQKNVRLAKVPLRVVQPLGISGTVTSPLKPGDKQKLKISAMRYDTAEPQPIEVTLGSFPSGITGPEKVTIAPGESEAVVEIAAQGEASTGKFNTLKLGATTVVKGVKVAVESSPIQLEVRK